MGVAAYGEDGDIDNAETDGEGSGVANDDLAASSEQPVQDDAFNKFMDTTENNFTNLTIEFEGKTMYKANVFNLFRVELD